MRQTFDFPCEDFHLVLPAEISVLAHHVYESFAGIFPLKVHALGMDDGGVSQVGLQRILYGNRKAVELVLYCLEQGRALRCVDKDE